MSDDISLMMNFWERCCGPEVSGHGLTLPFEQSAMIERFIAGSCDAAERRELSRFLQTHPNWIRWIAERIKAKRDVDESAVA